MGGGAIMLMASNDTRLAIPVLLWFAGYAALLCYFVAAAAGPPRGRNVGDALGALRPHRRQLHQHTHRQNCSPTDRATRTNSWRAAMDDLTDAFPRAAAVDGRRSGLDPLHPERGLGRRHRWSSRSWLWNDGRIPVGHGRDGNCR